MREIIEGEEYWAYFMKPTLSYPTKVKVVKTNIDKNIIECGLDYDVEDEKGNRLWNPHLVVNKSDKVKDNPDIEKYHTNNLLKWRSEGFNF